jgi:dihydrofolate reductase
MSKLTMNSFLSLDGVVQSPSAPTEDPSGGFRKGGWVVPFADPDVAQYLGDALATVDALLLGRRTYEIFAAHWPRVTDPDDPVALTLTLLPKYVVSSTLQKVEWHNTRLIRGDVVNEVAKLKCGHHQEIQIQGSAQLAQTLIDNDLIDEYRLWFYPVVLGSGKRLFGSSPLHLSLALIDTQTTSAGVVINTYRRLGPQRHDSFCVGHAECDPVA